METASLSVRPVLQHSLHNVIYITDERKSIQGSMSNKTLTQGVVLISISGLQCFCKLFFVCAWILGKLSKRILPEQNRLVSLFRLYRTSMHTLTFIISLQGVCETRDIDQRLFTVYDQSQNSTRSYSLRD